MNDMLLVSCAELREMAETHPDEIEVIVEMMIEAEADLCEENS
jgi:hypothetical protein